MFTYRIAEENGKPVAYIDRNGAVCIRQEINHKTGAVFVDAVEAEAWAADHAAELEAAELEAQRATEFAAVINQANLVNAIAQARNLIADMPEREVELNAFINSAMQQLSQSN